MPSRWSIRRSRWLVCALCPIGSALFGCDRPPVEPVQAAPSAPTAEVAPAPSSPAPSPEPGVAAARSAPSPAGAFKAERVALEGGAMGTKVTIATYTTEGLDEAALRPKLERALAEIRRVEALMTTWKDDSEVSRINAAAGRAPVVVGDETFAVIDKSQWISDLSEGTFDISFDAMRGLWKFDEGAGMHPIPAKPAVERARRLIDYRKIRVDREAQSVMLEREGMRISLGGIAKGYAVDRAASLLDEQGVAAYFVQAGGDLFVRGKKPDQRRFRVGIRDPRGKHEADFFAMLEVEDAAFSTAGDYERSFIADGRRYHHIIDPRTGFPATACRSVTVWAKDALTADAIDDAVFILGPKRGLELVESIEGVGAVIVDAANRVWISKRLEGLVEVLRPPTDGV